MKRNEIEIDLNETAKRLERDFSEAKSNEQALKECLYKNAEIHKELQENDTSKNTLIDDVNVPAATKQRRNMLQALNEVQIQIKDLGRRRINVQAAIHYFSKIKDDLS